MADPKYHPEIEKLEHDDTSEPRTRRVSVYGWDGSGMDKVKLAVDADGHLQADVLTGGGGGTQYTEGDTDASITGTAVMWEDGSDTLQPASAANPFPVEIIAGAGSGGTAAADDADFTAGTTSGTPAMGVYESTPTSVTDGDLGTVGITTGRRLKTSATIDAALPAGTNAIGKLAANSGVDIGDVDVTSSALPTGASTSANQTTIIGHVDGIETLLGTIDADTGNLATIETNTDFGTVVGGGTETGALRVTLANNSTGVVSVDDNGGALTVDGTVTVGNPEAIGGGTQYATNVAYADGNTGTIALVVRDDSLSTLTEADGDYSTLRVSSTGALHVTGGGGGTEYTEDVATANPIVGTATMIERDDVLSTVTPIEGDNIGLRGTAEGALWTQDFNSDAILADTTATKNALETAGGLVVNLGANNDVTVTGSVTADLGVNNDVTVTSGTITAELSATDNAVLDTIDAVLDTINAKLVTGTVIGDVNLGATDNAVLDTIAAKDFATQTTLAAMNAKMVTGTDIGDVTINNSTGAAAVNIQDGGNTITVDGTVAVTQSGTWDEVGINDSGNSITVDYATTGSGTATGALRVELPTNGTGVIATVGAVTAITNALPAGTNAIGKLAANSGVDIGDVDVTSLPALAAGTNAIGKVLPTDIDVTAHTNYAKKYYTSAGAATDGIIWSPAAGKRWHVVSMFINVSAAATVTLEDDLAGGDSPIWKAEFAANSGMTINFSEMYPLASGEDAADLTVTTSAGNVYITVTGYEV